jgi:hypothetical protein
VQTLKQNKTLKMNPLDVNKDPQAVLNENVDSKMTETVATEILSNNAESFPSVDQTIVEHEIEADNAAPILIEAESQTEVEEIEIQSNNDSTVTSTDDDQVVDFSITEQQADESIEAVKSHHNEYASLSKKELIETLQSLIEQEVDQVKIELKALSSYITKK